MARQKITGDWGQNVAFACEVCGKLFDAQIAAIGHERAKHGMHGASPKRRNACRICGKRWKDGAALQAHMSIAHGVLS